MKIYSIVICLCLLTAGCSSSGNEGPEIPEEPENTATNSHITRTNYFRWFT